MARVDAETACMHTESGKVHVSIVSLGVRIVTKVVSGKEKCALIHLFGTMCVDSFVWNSSPGCIKRPSKRLLQRNKLRGGKMANAILHPFCVVRRHFIERSAAVTTEDYTRKCM